MATTLPLTDRPVGTSSGAVPPFFANLLPEGRRLAALRRSVKTSADDELSLLIAVGTDPVGDVQVLGDPDAVDEPTEPAAPVEGRFDELDFAELLATHGIGDPSALAGVQDKVSGRRLTIPLVHGGRSHLLKFDVHEFPRVVENEAYFLRIARGLRHPVVDAAVEDGAQVLGVHSADKYSVTMEQLASRIGDVCRSRPLALRAVLQQTVFAWATGNGDLHAKNISVLGGAERHVAPIDDIPSTVPYGDATFALPLAGRRENLTAKAFRAFARDIGLTDTVADGVLNELLSATDHLADEIAGGAIGWDDRRRQDILRALRRRRLALLA